MDTDKEFEKKLLVALEDLGHSIERLFKARTGQERAQDRVSKHRPWEEKAVEPMKPLFSSDETVGSLRSPENKTAPIQYRNRAVWATYKGASPGDDFLGGKQKGFEYDQKYFIEIRASKESGAIRVQYKYNQPGIAVIEKIYETVIEFLIDWSDIDSE